MIVPTCSFTQPPRMGPRGVVYHYEKKHDERVLRLLRGKAIMKSLNYPCQPTTLVAFALLGKPELFEPQKLGNKTADTEMQRCAASPVLPCDALCGVSFFFFLTDQLGMQLRCYLDRTHLEGFSHCRFVVPFYNKFDTVLARTGTLSSFFPLSDIAGRRHCAAPVD